MKSRVFQIAVSGVTALLCLALLIAIFVTRQHVSAFMLSARWCVLAICLGAASIRACIPGGGALVSLACGAIPAASAFFAILFHAIGKI
jgi:hypothetical protein